MFLLPRNLSNHWATMIYKFEKYRFFLLEEVGNRVEAHFFADVATVFCHRICAQPQKLTIMLRLLKRLHGGSLVAVVLLHEAAV